MIQTKARDYSIYSFRDTDAREMADRDLAGNAEPEEMVLLRSEGWLERWVYCLKEMKREVEAAFRRRRMIENRYKARLSEGDITISEYRGEVERIEEWRERAGITLAAIENRLQEAKSIQRGEDDD